MDHEERKACHSTLKEKKKNSPLKNILNIVYFREFIFSLLFERELVTDSVKEMKVKLFLLSLGSSITKQKE